MKQKHCSYCRELKDFGCFSRYADKRISIGYAYRSQCKECVNTIYAGRYRGGVHKNDPLKMREVRKRYWAKNPEKLEAQKKAQYAFRKGILTRKPCVVCGEQKVHGHHPDYSKPLDVIWLCASHHKKVHTGTITL